MFSVLSVFCGQDSESHRKVWRANYKAAWKILFHVWNVNVCHRFYFPYTFPSPNLEAMHLLASPPQIVKEKQKHNFDMVWSAMIMFTKQHLLTYVHRIYVYNTYSFVYHPIQTQTVTFKRDSAAPIVIEVLHRRVGRPRKQWTFESLKITWSKIRTDHSNSLHRVPNLNVYTKQPLTNKFETTISCFLPGSTWTSTLVDINPYKPLQTDNMLIDWATSLWRTCGGPGMEGRLRVCRDF